MCPLTEGVPEAFFYFPVGAATRPATCFFAFNFGQGCAAGLDATLGIAPAWSG
jgi:hypothetical protein